MIEEKELLNKVLSGTVIKDKTYWENELSNSNYAVIQKIGLIKLLWQNILKVHDTEWLKKELKVFHNEPGGILTSSCTSYQDSDLEECYVEALEEIEQSEIDIKKLNVLIRAMQLRVVDALLSAMDGQFQIAGKNVTFATLREEDAQFKLDKELGQMFDDFYIFDPDYDSDCES